MIFIDRRKKVIEVGVRKVHKLETVHLGIVERPTDNLSPRAAVDSMRTAPHRTLTEGPAVSLDALSRRQREVLDLIVQGLTNIEIARSLGLGKGTVKIHVAALFGKLGVRRRAAVALRARDFSHMAF
jgi:DNA-binding NarL/FixJ family response regulator